MSFPDYETAIGKEIKAFLSKERNYPIELQHLLFAANRWEKSEEIKSHLQSGKTLIVNRYTESNLVYGLANGLDRRWLESLENGLPKTNLVIVLDAPPQSLKSRRAGSSKDAYERNSALQNKAQKAYRELARENGWKLVDADRPVEEVRRGLGLDNFVLFGHSWGGMLAIDYALKYQQHLRGLVISDMTAGTQSYLKRTAALKLQPK